MLLVLLLFECCCDTNLFEICECWKARQHGGCAGSKRVPYGDTKVGKILRNLVINGLKYLIVVTIFHLPALLDSRCGSRSSTPERLSNCGPMCSIAIVEIPTIGITQKFSRYNFCFVIAYLYLLQQVCRNLWKTNCNSSDEKVLLRRVVSWGTSSEWHWML